jgi:hypothetical protein
MRGLMGGETSLPVQALGNSNCQQPLGRAL